MRSFNRTVTQRVGALRDHFLSRQRPLGAARVLWEIGALGCDVRTLRRRLDLDAGYLSRILRSLEADGLVTVGPSDADRRVRTVRPTVKGRAEQALLDRRSDEVARSVLEHLGASQQARLVAAMGEVERLLTASLVEIDEVDPASSEALWCVGQYFSELDRRFDAGFDPVQSLPADVDELRPPDGIFVVARLRGDPIGCGALKFHGRSPAELKRMWVAPAARGLGVGRRLLTALEARASSAGATVVRLETNRALTEAIAMYRAAGFREVVPFNEEPYADHWFEKDLTAR